jgi:hypothetical protein
MTDINLLEKPLLPLLLVLKLLKLDMLLLHLKVILKKLLALSVKMQNY